MKPGEALATYQSTVPRRRAWRLNPRPCTNLSRNWPRRALAGRSPELLRGFNCVVSEGMRRSVRWPRRPTRWAMRCAASASNLRAAGIEIQFSRADIRGRRVVSLVCASGGKIVSLLSVTVNSGELFRENTRISEPFHVFRGPSAQKRAGRILTVTDSN